MALGGIEYDKRVLNWDFFIQELGKEGGIIDFQLEQIKQEKENQNFAMLFGDTNKRVKARHKEINGIPFLQQMARKFKLKVGTQECCFEIQQ